MSTPTKVHKRSQTSTSTRRLEIWRKARGLLTGRGPKNVIAWQRRGRKDRKLLSK